MLRVGLALLDFMRKFAGDKEKVCPVERVQRMRKQDFLVFLLCIVLFLLNILPQLERNRGEV